jgi:hypothetical protein
MVYISTQIKLRETRPLTPRKTQRNQSIGTTFNTVVMIKMVKE